jgi:hypothetical protein
MPAQRESNNQKAVLTVLSAWLVSLLFLSSPGIMTATTLESDSVLAALVCMTEPPGPRRAIALVSGSAFCSITISLYPCKKSRYSSVYYVCEDWGDCTTPQAAPQPGIYNSTDALVAAGAQSDRAAEVQVAVVFAATALAFFVIPYLSSIPGKTVARVACALASAAVSSKLLVDSRLLQSAASSWAVSGEAEPLMNCSYPIRNTVDVLRPNSGIVGAASWMLALPILLLMPFCVAEEEDEAAAAPVEDEAAAAPVAAAPAAAAPAAAAPAAAAPAAAAPAEAAPVAAAPAAAGPFSPSSPHLPPAAAAAAEADNAEEQAREAASRSLALAAIVAEASRKQSSAATAESVGATASDWGQERARQSSQYRWVL